jgi:hypothetical protein
MRRCIVATRTRHEVYDETRDELIGSYEDLVVAQSVAKAINDLREAEAAERVASAESGKAKLKEFLALNGQDKETI